MKWKAIIVLAAAAAAAQNIRFCETGAGVVAPLENAATPQKHQIETMVGGVALLDYDGDGRLDLFLANGASQPSLHKQGPKYWNRLYRNLGGFRFMDVTERAGVRGEGFSIGAAVADYDNDRDPDLFVAGVNRNLLYRNRGGTFEDVTDKAGIAQGRWAVGGGWFDYDRDGWLDLFVVNYVHWDPAREPFCGDRVAGFRTYCHPQFYKALPNVLLRNNGDGTFQDVSVRTGIAAHAGKGMAVAFADYDGDGWTDAFVTNDTTPNFLFHNLGKEGKFEEAALKAGVAMNDDGRALSSMGVDFRDIDNDGRPDVFITALANETHPLYRNLGGGLFLDVTYPSRIGTATLPLSGWGAGILDFDNDGRKDIFAANGDVQDNTEVYSSRQSRQSNLVLRNEAGGAYSASVAGTPAMHRGAAFGDLDGDGKVDAVVTRIGQAPLLLRNCSDNRNHWLGIRLEGRRGNRDGIGAVVKIGNQWNHVTTAVGYASASEPAARFGLGAQGGPVTIEIAWPGGLRQTITAAGVDRVLTVREPAPGLVE